MNETTTTESKTVRAPTFVGWLQSEEPHHRGDDVGWLANRVTTDHAGGCLTATSPAAVRHHLITAHHANHQPRQKALRALDRAEVAYARHVRQLEATCRRIRYEFIPTDPEAPQ